MQNAFQPLLLRRHDVASQKTLESGSECLRPPHAAHRSAASRRLTPVQNLIVPSVPRSSDTPCRKPAHQRATFDPSASRRVPADRQRLGALRCAPRDHRTRRPLDSRRKRTAGAAQRSSLRKAHSRRSAKLCIRRRTRAGEIGEACGRDDRHLLTCAPPAFLGATAHLQVPALPDE